MREGTPAAGGGGTRGARSLDGPMPSLQPSRVLQVRFPWGTGGVRVSGGLGTVGTVKHATSPRGCLVSLPTVLVALFQLEQVLSKKLEDVEGNQLPSR